MAATSIAVSVAKFYRYNKNHYLNLKGKIDRNTELGFSLLQSLLSPLPGANGSPEGRLVCTSEDKSSIGDAEVFYLGHD